MNLYPLEGSVEGPKNEAQILEISRENRSANPSEGTRAVTQPFRLKPVSPRRESSKTRKRSYEHGKRFADPSACIKHL